MIPSFIFPVAAIIIIGFVFYRVFGGIYNQMQNRNRLSKEGIMMLANVVSISQTGTTVNQVPEMKLILDLDNATGRPRRVEIKQLIDLGALPRVGDRIYVLVDPQNPDNVIISPNPSGSGMQMKIVDSSGNQTGTVDMGTDEAKGYISMPPELRERGKPGVAKVVAVEPVGEGLSHITLDLDNIGQPNKRVTITQHIDGFAPPVGTRIYYIYDPENPDNLMIAPAALTMGQTLGIGTNRLDPLVLGPQLLQIGAKANGKVLSAQALQMANPIFASQGFSKWELKLRVTPLNAEVSPYEATLTTSFTTKEKADKIAHIGAEVPLRYDPLDLLTICIDSIAMGYPDPYEAALKAFDQQRGEI